MTPPRIVPGWYIVCASRELRRGEIRRFELGDEAIVVFRGRDTGVVHTLPAHCLHQGVDLTHGSVIGDCLRCPLHHWEYGVAQVKIPGSAPRNLRARHCLAERFGMIFLHTGAEPAYPIPSFSVDDDAIYFRAGKPVEIECPWYVPVANAFDMTHLRTVHRRELRRVPEIAYPDPVTFTCNYATAVIGDAWSDRAMRALSGNDIRVEVTCSGGTILMVESHIRHRRGFLFVSLRPTRSGVSILPVFGVPRKRSGAHLMQGRISAALFTAFLHRDVETLSGIRFPPGYLDNTDETINACYRYLCQLPEYSSEEMS
ncbi:MAG TPA: Rieske 2Fe-2S domain-containing protein [Thermoanaerobaculia bacterium]|nr:Rieske 2Fe-2S domain-containing protein [Thermoanaerobaculia bacterium]